MIPPRVNIAKASPPNLGDSGIISQYDSSLRGYGYGVYTYQGTSSKVEEPYGAQGTAHNFFFF